MTLFLALTSCNTFNVYCLTCNQCFFGLTTIPFEGYYKWHDVHERFYIIATTSLKNKVSYSLHYQLFIYKCALKNLTSIGIGIGYSGSCDQKVEYRLMNFFFYYWRGKGVFPKSFRVLKIARLNKRNLAHYYSSNKKIP